ncbi:Phage tail assembly [Sphingobacterium faecium PCAi_F2.5]|nr:Phage tail assembly [Sphingobacterium faecium PCAi_F2.5]
MTIVASNSLTVSNVNDGTITHTAYANSADGKDGFTTVYPNLNLLEGTSNQVVQATDWYMKVADIKYDKSLGGDLCASVMINNADHASVLAQGGAYITIETLDQSRNVLATVNGNGVSYNANGLSQCYVSIDDNTASVKVVIFTNNMFRNAFYSCLKIEKGTTATPHMPSSSEVTTADWPSYIGQYTDFMQADSTNPTDYTWSLIRGNDGKDGATGKDGIAGKDGKGIKATVITYQASTNGTTAPTGTWAASVPTVPKGSFLWTRTIWTYTDNTTETGYAVAYMGTNGNNGHDGIAGKDGVGIKTTTITYAGSTSGTTAPTSGWTSTVPTVAAGSYLWTKTVWDYTDNSFETGYSVGKMGNTGPAGSNGNPGKVVSDKEPTTKFVGLTWKYSGITAIDASDGTNIQPNTEYYWNGKSWVIYLINAQNIDVKKLTALTANLGDATAGSLTVEKGATGGIAVKDGLVKSWDISKMTDPNYPDGYSYTSMGVALDSGGLTFYSAGYGHTLDKGGVIDSQYKVASLQAIASNGRNSIGTGLVLNATNSNFPFTINGNIDVIGGIRQTSKTASVTIGAGLILSLERRGEMVIAILTGTINSSLTSGKQFSVGEIPLGYRPNTTANIPAHMASSYNSAHIDAGIDGVCTWFGPATSSGYPRGTQMWFTNDSLPN